MSDFDYDAIFAGAPRREFDYDAIFAEAQSSPTAAFNRNLKEVQRYTQGQLQSMAEADLEALNGPTVMREIPDYTAGEKAVGVLENVASVATGLLTGAVTEPINNAAAMFDTWGNIIQGEDPYRAAFDAKNRAGERSASTTYVPRTPAGQEYGGVVGEFLNQYIAPLEPALASLDIVPHIPFGMHTANLDANAVAHQARRAQQDADLAPLVRQTELNAPDPILATSRERPSVGAQGVSRAEELAATAATAPVPFAGDAAPTWGQATRDYGQWQFERETSKNPTAGDALRARFESQQQVMGQNFDALGEQYLEQGGRLYGSDAELGAEVRGVVDQQRRTAKNEATQLYNVARDSGSGEAPIVISGLGEVIQESALMDPFVPGNKSIRDFAINAGIVSPDGRPMSVRLEEAERLRQLVNHAYDPVVPREARLRRMWLDKIDAAMDQVDAGPAYAQARNSYRNYANEFKNTPLNRDMTTNKRGTNQPVMADEQVFGKVILNAPLSALQKVRRTLEGTEQGRQAWASMQARLVDHIRTKAFGTQMDAGGNPVVSPGQFFKTVRDLDQSGRLAEVLGPRTAAQLTDLAELSRALFTAPPGSVNHSNTASALLTKLDSLGRSSDIPAVGFIVKAISDSYRSNQIKRQVERSLDTKGLLSE